MPAPDQLKHYFPTVNREPREHEHRSPAILVALFTLVLGVSPLNVLANPGQGPGGEIKPKPSASPAPGKPTHASSKPTRIPGPVPVRIAKVTEQTFAETLSAVGVVMISEMVAVSPRVSGRLNKISVNEGASVKRGDALAEIDSSVYRANEQQAESALAQARRELDALPAGSSKRPAAAYLVRQKQAEHDSAVARLADCIVSSPADGVVRGVSMSEGQTVTVDSRLMEIEATGELHVQVDTSTFVARDVQVKNLSIHVGQIARVSDEQAAYVARVDKVTTAPGNPKRIISIDLYLPRTKAFQAGDKPRVEIDMEPTTLVSVPKEAVVRSARNAKVLIVENGKALERMVTTGVTGPDWIEIRSGVKPGQSVIVDPKDLRSGQAVIVGN